MAYYNYRLFGNPLTLPYQVNRASYVFSNFLWQTPRPEPVYRHAAMRDFYTNLQLADFKRFRTVPGFSTGTAKKLGIASLFFFGVALFIPLVALPWAIFDGRVRFLVLAGGTFLAGLSFNAWFFPHYAAPFTAGFYAILLQAMRHLRIWRPEGRGVGLALVRFVPLLCVVLVGVRLLAGPLKVDIERWPAMWYGTEPLGLARAHVLTEMDRLPGRQLAIVRYHTDHNSLDEWVYNAADIDDSKMVWAREMDSASNAVLLGYFRDRPAWLVEPDANPPRISPYLPEKRLLVEASFRHQTLGETP
jgi:hypothetical protein